MPSCPILGEAAIQEATLGSLSWNARVPEASNVSDAASRLKFERIERFLPGARWADPVGPSSWAAEVAAPVEGDWFRGR